MNKNVLIPIIIGVVAVAILAVVKIIPYYATLIALATFVGGCFAGYFLKKKEIVEKVVEIPVEKVVYKDRVVTVPTEVCPKTSKKKSKE